MCEIKWCQAIVNYISATHNFRSFGKKNNENDQHYFSRGKEECKLENT